MNENYFKHDGMVHRICKLSLLQQEDKNIVTLKWWINIYQNIKEVAGKKHKQTEL